MLLSNHLIFSHPLLPSPSISASIRVFSNESALYTSSDESIWASASTSVLSMNIQALFPLGWTSWISLQPKGLSRVFSNTTAWKHQFFDAQPSLWFNSLMTTGKKIALMIWTCASKVMSLLLNLLSKFVIVFLPRSQCLLILWLQSPSIVILEPKKIKSVRYYFTIKIVELYPVAYLSYMLKLSKTFK